VYMSKMKEIEDPKDLIRGKNYYIEKVSQESGGSERSEGKAIGIHFKGTEPFDKEKHYYVDDGAVLGYSPHIFQEGNDLVMFKKVIPLNPKKHAHMAKVTHFKPYHTHPIRYKSRDSYLGYKFYEVTNLLRLEDIFSKRAISNHLESAPFLKHLNERDIHEYLESAPFLKHLNERDIHEYLGLKSSPPHHSKSHHSKSHHSKSHHSKSHHSKSHHSKSPRSKSPRSKKGGKFKKRGRRTRKKSHNRNTKRLLH
jgi:hypothetical protein